MKKMALLLAGILLCGLVACMAAPADFEGLPVTPVPAEQPGDEMDDQQVKDLFVSLYAQAETLRFWWQRNPRESDVDTGAPSLEGQPDDYDPDGFRWLPLMTFASKEELYRAHNSVLHKDFVRLYLDDAFDAPPPLLKEIEGRLYVRSTGNGGADTRVEDFESIRVLSKKPRQIEVSLDVIDAAGLAQDPLAPPAATYTFVMTVQDGHWVLNRW